MSGSAAWIATAIPAPGIFTICRRRPDTTGWKDEMTALLYIVGLVIGAAAFFYLLSAFRSGKEKVMEMTGKKPPAKTTVEPGRISNLAKRAPGSRTCPLCGSELTKYEALYASVLEEGSGRKILIHGCRYCYKQDEDPDRVKRSAL
jgi:hypothetical protein